MSEVAEKVKVRKSAKQSAEYYKALYETKLAEEQRAKLLFEKKNEWKKKEDAWVREIIKKVSDLQDVLSAFKEESMSGAEKLYDELFTQISGNDIERKPAIYCLKTLDRKLEVEFDASEKYALDETAAAAVAKIQGFLASKFKGKEEYKALYAMVNTILSRNKAGDYNPTLVAKLAKIKNDGLINDEEFVQGVEMLEAAQISAGKASYIRFYECNEKGVRTPITIQFSKL